jgi:spore protease
MAFCPSVMGLTGIETVDIVEGVIYKVKPTHVIIIDSLCASAVERLGKSLQVTNTGICPGRGIGNDRKCIGKSIAQNVYSIGVPLLIYSSTFISEMLTKHSIDIDLINSVMQKYNKSSENKVFFDILNSIKSVINDNSNDLILCIKDIEECVEILSDIIAKSINIILGVD